MSVIQDKANAIAADMAKNNVEQRVALDPMVVITIIGIVVDVIKTLVECYINHKQAQERLANPGVLEKWRLRRIVRQHLNDDEMNNYVGANIVQSSINVGKTLTDDEVQSMYSEVQEQK